MNEKIFFKIQVHLNHQYEERLKVNVVLLKRKQKEKMIIHNQAYHKIFKLNYSNNSLFNINNHYNRNHPLQMKIFNNNLNKHPYFNNSNLLIHLVSKQVLRLDQVDLVILHIIQYQINYLLQTILRQLIYQLSSNQIKHSKIN